MEGADGLLDDHDVAGVDEAVGEAAARRLFAHIGSVDAYERHGALLGPERIGQPAAPREYFLAGVRCDGQGHDAGHRIDRDQCSGHGVIVGPGH